MTDSDQPQRRDPLVDIRDNADDLTDPRRHAEPIYDTDEHRNKRMRRAYTTTQPGLLRQLADLIPPGSATGDDGGHAPPASRPPIYIEAASVYIQVTIAACRWCWSLRIEQRDTVEGNIRALVGAATRLDSDTQITLRDELRQWRNWAATLTGWRNPPITVRAPCPVCATPGKLRINPERRTACCLGCGAGWSEDDLDKLAGHVTSYGQVSAAQAEVAKARARADRDARRRSPAA